MSPEIAVTHVERPLLNQTVVLFLIIVGVRQDTIVYRLVLIDM